MLLNSKKLLFLLTVLSVSRLLQGAQPAVPVQANISANAAQEYFQKLTNAENAFRSVPANLARPLIDELNAIKGDLQNFAKAYMAAYEDAKNSGKQDIVDALKTIANVDLEKKPVIRELRSKLGRIHNNLYLIQFLANPDIPIQNDESFRNQLSYAGYENKPEKIKILLALGANPNYTDIHGLTSLTYAESHGNPAYQETIDLLKAVTA